MALNNDEALADDLRTAVLTTAERDFVSLQP